MDAVNSVLILLSCLAGCVIVPNELTCTTFFLANNKK